jgi:hypothetical protein
VARTGQGYGEGGLERRRDIGGAAGAGGELDQVAAALGDAHRAPAPRP